MNIEQAELQLQSEGLRIARSGESGRAWVWIHADGAKVCWWVTDAA